MSLEVLIVGAVLVVKVRISSIIVAVRRWWRSVRLVVRVLRVLLALADLRPVGVCVLPRLVEAVRDEDVVEDRPRVHGPQLEADRTNVVVRVHVLHELLVRDLLRLPDALVGRIIDALRIPLTLVVRVVDLRRLPVAILVVIPVVGLRRARVVDLLAHVPVLRLLVLRVIDHRLVHPVGRLGIARVIQSLRRELPVLVKTSSRLALLVQENLKGVVRLHQQRVQVRQLVLVIVSQLDVLRLQQVLAVVVEDDVNARDIVAADVRAKHDLVVRVASEVLLVDVAPKQLDVAAPAEGATSTRRTSEATRTTRSWS